MQELFNSFHAVSGSVRKPSWKRWKYGCHRRSLRDGSSLRASTVAWIRTGNHPCMARTELSEWEMSPELDAVVENSFITGKVGILKSWQFAKAEHRAVPCLPQRLATSECNVHSVDSTRFHLLSEAATTLRTPLTNNAWMKIDDSSVQSRSHCASPLSVSKASTSEREVGKSCSGVRAYLHCHGA